MTTQRQVIGAFLNWENSPTVASNLRAHYDGAEGALVSAEAHVLAHRQPMRTMRLWTRFPEVSRDATIAVGYVRDHFWAIRHTMRNRNLTSEPTVREIRERPPEPEQFSFIDQ